MMKHKKIRARRDKMFERLIIIIMPVGVIIMRMYDRDKEEGKINVGEWNYKSLYERVMFCEKLMMPGNGE